MIEILIILFVIAFFSGLGKWATAQRLKRKYEEQYKDCCGSNCGCHEENKKNKWWL